MTIRANRMQLLRFGLIVLMFLQASACQSSVEANNMCIFSQNDRAEPNISATAERLFQQGRAHDVNVISDRRDTLPEDLRNQTPDRAVAKAFYQQAADQGHTGAMNNLAVYLHEGWGEGRGNYVPDYAEAYRMNVEMARRGDARGYVGMASYLFGSDLGAAKPEKAVACLVEGAKLSHPDAIRLLAIDDLGQRELGPAQVRPSARITRGIDLLEALFQRGHPIAFLDLAEYHKRVTADWEKYEFFARTAAAAGVWQARIDLVGAYQNGMLPRDTADEAQCLDALATSDLPNLERLCPRPGGPLARADVGLSAAIPIEDMAQYLNDFAAAHPDL